MLLGSAFRRLSRRFCVSSEMLASISILHSATTSQKTFADSKALRNYLEETTLVSGKKTLAYLESTDRTLFANKITLSSQLVPGGHGETTSVVMQGIILDLIESCFASWNREGKKQKFKVLDVGCGTGGITFGIAHLLNQVNLEHKIVGVDLDEASINKAKTAKQNLGTSATNVDFGLVDAFEYLESDKNFDLIVFGIGITNSDLLTTWMMNSASVTTEEDVRIVIAPIFESNTQQGLNLFCNNNDLLDTIRSHLAKHMKFLGGALPQPKKSSNGEFSTLRIMPCFFSPVLYPNAQQTSESSETEDSDLSANQTKLLSALKNLSGENGGLDRGNRPKPLKMQSLDELNSTLSQLEQNFKTKFAAQKSAKPDFGIKDVQSDPELGEMLTLIQTVKKHVKSRQQLPKV